MKSRALLVIVALLLLVCLVALVVGLVLTRTRMAQASEQPLVLINAPTSGAQVWIDRAAPVLVTARSGNEIARVELWANGRLQENRAVPQEGLTTFSTAFVWQPQRPGAYTLVARAFDARGNAGQATVAVRVVENLPPDEPPVPPPSEGEGAPGHSDEPGTGEAPIGEEEVPPGEEEPPPGEEEAPPEAEAPPEEGAPDPDPVGPADEVVEVGEGESGQVMLTLEAVGLNADFDYHGINCYFTVADAETEQVAFGLAMMPPYLWEPTEPVSATFPWPSDQPLPVRVECTGVSPPAEAISLGEPVEGEALPETWDGRDLHLEWPGAYDFVYRVQFGVGVTSEDIPAPTNLHLEDVPLSTLKMLRWDWAGDEAQIDGFRLYLNGSLQWRVADPSARFTYLPPEWTEPPCGQYFDFQVTAYDGPFPGGVESPPGAMAPLEPEPGRCGGIYRVTFEEIHFTPLDYPADLPDVADADGRAGPLYGWFFAQGNALPFDTIQSNGSVAGIRVEGGESFALADTLFGDPYRYHQNSVVFQWDNDWAVLDLFGVLVDYDWGETDDQDDFLCGGGAWPLGPPPPDAWGAFHCTDGSGLIDVAVVVYHLEELPEWPEGEPPPGAVPGAPRPDLVVHWWDLSPAGELTLMAGNMGMAAAVPEVDLSVELEGAVLGDYTIPSGDDPFIGEWDGWYSEFTLPDHTFGSLADLCTLQVTVDPANYYLEYDEENNTIAAADLEYAWHTHTNRPTPVEADLELSVQYLSCHGDPVGVRAVPLVGGAEAADFLVETVPVLYGHSWPVPIHVEYTGIAPLTTDSWRLEMIDLVTSEVFFSDEVEDTQEWTP